MRTGQTPGTEQPDQEKMTSMQPLILESLAAAEGTPWLVQGTLRVLDGRDLRIIVGANRGLDPVVEKMDLMDLLSVGETSRLPHPFEDMRGRTVRLTKTGRRAAQRVADGAPSEDETCSCPLCTGVKPEPEKRRKKREPQAGPGVKKRRGRKNPQTKAARRSARTRVAMMLVREIDEICRYCMDAPAETADHVRPLDRGGSNSPFNLVGCCAECNGKKDNLYPAEAGMVLHVPLRWFTSTGLRIWR